MPSSVSASPGFHEMPGTSAASLVTNLQENGVKPYVIDGPADKMAIMDAIAVSMSFPEYFGRNYDALSDCLRDLAWLPEGPVALIWRHPSVLRSADIAAYNIILDVMKQAVEDMALKTRPLSVILLD